MKTPNPTNRGREDWVVNLVEFHKKGRGELTFDPMPLFEHLERIEMAYRVGPKLVLFTCVKPQYEIKEVRIGQFPVMMSLN